VPLRKNRGKRRLGGKKKPRKKKSVSPDDSALKAGYLEEYAARDGKKRLSRLRTAMGIHAATLDRWMEDPAFVANVKAIDDRRLRSAEGLATTIWPEIVERQAQIATGALPDPPREPKRTKDYAYQVRLRIEGYKAACAAAVRVSTRAAEFVAKYLGQLQTEGNAFAVSPETFGKLTDLTSRDELAAELIRREKLLEAWNVRLETKRAKKANP